MLQRCRIGDAIITEAPAGKCFEVAVAGIKGSQVRVGAEAPAGVVILR